MRTLALILLLSVSAIGTFSQGIVNFSNNPQTLVRVAGSGAPISGPPGSYYFGLLIAPPGTMDIWWLFTFANVYATNNATAPGQFELNGVAVPGWAAGVTMSYAVVGWSSALGHDFNPAWLFGSLPPGAVIGISGVGTGTAGGTDALGHSFPTLDLFEGTTGINSGFVLGLPEPSAMAIAMVGAATLWVFRRRR